MGTSKGYSPPTGYLWSSVKRTVTSMINNNCNSESVGRAIGKYVQATKQGNGGLRENKNQLVASTGAKALNFFNYAQKYGLNESLREAGLQNLIGKSNEEIYSGLLDYFTEIGSSLNESIVRDSMAEVMKDIFLDKEDQNFDEIFNSLNMNNFIKNLIVKFVQKDFITNFSEKIEAKCDNLDEYIKIEKDIKEFISSEIDLNYKAEDLNKIDWSGTEGREFINKKTNEVLEIFEMYLEE